MQTELILNDFEKLIDFVSKLNDRPETYHRYKYPTSQFHSSLKRQSTAITIAMGIIETFKSHKIPINTDPLILLILMTSWTEVDILLDDDMNNVVLQHSILAALTKGVNPIFATTLVSLWRQHAVNVNITHVSLCKLCYLIADVHFLLEDKAKGCLYASANLAEIGAGLHTLEFNTEDEACAVMQAIKTYTAQSIVDIISPKTEGLADAEV